MPRRRLMGLLLVLIGCSAVRHVPEWAVSVADTGYHPATGLPLHVRDDTGREWVLIPPGRYGTIPPVATEKPFYASKNPDDFGDEVSRLIMPPTDGGRPPYVEGIPYRWPSENERIAMSAFFRDMVVDDDLRVWIMMNRVVREP